jgi:hypothetical protein
MYAKRTLLRLAAAALLVAGTTQAQEPTIHHARIIAGNGEVIENPLEGCRNWARASLVEKAGKAVVEAGR